MLRTMIRASVALALGLLASTPAVAQKKTEVDLTPVVKIFTVVPGEPLAPEAIAADPEVEGIYMSPTGRYVATIARQEKATYLIIQDIVAKSQPTHMSLGDSRVSDFLWVSDDRIVYSVGARKFDVDFKQRGLVVTGFPQYFAMDRTFGNVVPLMGRGRYRIAGGKIGFAAGAESAIRIYGDTEHVLMQSRTDNTTGVSRGNSSGSREDGRLDLQKVNLKTGKATLLGRGSDYTMYWVTDRTGYPAMRIDTNPRGTELRIMTQSPDDPQKWVEAKRVLFDRESNTALDFIPLAPGPARGQYYVAARLEGADRMAIHLYDTVGQKFISQVHGDPAVDVTDARFDLATGAFSAGVSWSGMMNMTFADKTKQAHYDGLREYFGKGLNVSIASASDDGNVWLVAAFGPAEPGSYHVYDTRKANVVDLRRVKPIIPESALSASTPITYKARDGLTIHGYFTPPVKKNVDVKPPLIVYPHGGPESRDTADYHPVVQFLAAKGYAVFQPNFRGSSGYGQAFAKAGHRQWGRAMQDDINDGMDWIGAQGWADTSRACIMGESYGGYAAMIGIARDADRFKCSAASMGVSDMNMMLRWERREEGSDSRAVQYWTTQMGDVGRDKKEMDENSAVYMIDRIKGPLLLMHGKEDNIVPIEQSERMEKAMREAGKDVKLVVFEKGGHSFQDGVLLTYLTELEAFLDKHLPVNSQ
jgi:dipeptidyl aminopeptidase/acylaminoacyl peptidase